MNQLLKKQKEDILAALQKKLEAVLREPIGYTQRAVITIQARRSFVDWVRVTVVNPPKGRVMRRSDEPISQSEWAELLQTHWNTPGLHMVLKALEKNSNQGLSENELRELSHRPNFLLIPGRIKDLGRELNSRGRIRLLIDGEVAKLFKVSKSRMRDLKRSEPK